MSPLNQEDIDNAISEGVTKGQQMYDDARSGMMQSYDEARKKAEWYALLEKMIPGMPGPMVEKKLLEADAAKYNQAKAMFLKGGKDNGTVRGQ